MRTIGAKFNDIDFEDCEEIREKLGLSRTQYVRTALSFFNFVVKYHARTLFTEPVLERGEPLFEGQTESPLIHDTFVRSDFLLREKESGP